MVKIIAGKSNGLEKDSAADCFQVRSISKQRFIRKLGKITNINLNDIKSGLAKVLSINVEY